MSRILVIGSLNVDMGVRVDHTPRAGETILASEMTRIPGGKGANQACAIGRLGGDAVMLGAVGNDGNARLSRDNLEAAGVNVDHLITKGDCETGIAFITINAQGDNCIVVIPGANAALTVADIQEHQQLLRECEIVIMQMEIPMDVILYVARTAREMGKTVILDPAPVPAEFPEEVLRYVDIIKPNETELSMLTNTLIDKNDLRTVHYAMADLHERGIRNIVVSLGSVGAMVSDGSGDIEVIPACKVQTVDTTAAGDTFTAAMALRILDGSSLVEAVRFANVAAAISVTRFGAQSSIPTIEEVQQMMQDNQ